MRSAIHGAANSCPKDNSCAKRNAFIREKRTAFLRVLLIRHSFVVTPSPHQGEGFGECAPRASSPSGWRSSAAGDDETFRTTKLCTFSTIPLRAFRRSHCEPLLQRRPGRWDAFARHRVCIGAISCKDHTHRSRLLLRAKSCLPVP